MRQQQQQQPDYDLLAVFGDEGQADVAAAKLRKEGFAEEEVHQMERSQVGSGEFREHGPNRERGSYFLQTRRAGPRPVALVLFALISGLILGALAFGATFAFPTLPEPLTLILGVVLGILIGVVIGVVRGGRVRGDIGQQVKAVPEPKGLQGARTVVALRFRDSDNISRNSRARAILINNQGKIDRSIGRRE